ncbi:MAG: hypothetical protein A2945_02535 [Candidatus Liptonbacteria bacterium RIFCSPLOWO2_01_FULL_52_25]|uniref:Phosphoribosyltransferase domain-containing protein n=1 Tax=Candidatus Liptonbacteria bacterium RIFCSPLOWO2_01_FULL_52_25 TaxID=1798650 RepID=A0A1G2CHG1_9BACT|nr:MAG: hypothetical protein A2945_02535 [Candidatus Liptonbacteria bacterium RIFCSPLOWO2_01_FULL_52_25]
MGQAEFGTGKTEEHCMSKPDKERYSWKQFEDDCETLAVWARGKKFKSIFGIPRGGLVLAVKLSHLLDIPLVLNREDITGHTLIVDDIADSGGTLERLKSTFGGHCAIATIYKGENPRVAPDFSLRVKREWVVFPWETEQTSRYDETV